MISILYAVALCVAVCILLPSLFFLFEVIAGYVCRSLPKEQLANDRFPDLGVVIVMPAHNEAAGIEGTIHSLLPQLNNFTRLLVVADNCSDNTYEIVSTFADRFPYVTVIQRHDTARRGKGYALNHGIEYLKASPPEAVIILDADCKISAGGIAMLAAQCRRHGNPVQALYLMHNPPQNTGVAAKLTEFAWVVKNQVRALGGRALGVPCPLMGTGMVFRWVHISNAHLATGHLVEDMQLGVDLAMSGTPPIFCNSVLVTSEFPVSGEGQQSQRTRWEHGHLTVILNEVPKLLVRGLKDLDAKLLLAAIDVAIPPLALLAMLTSVSLFAGFSVWLWQGYVAALYLSGTAVVSIVLGVGIAWLGFGRNILTLSELGFIPLYVVRKIPLYVFFLFKRQTAWVRSKREGEK